MILRMRFILSLVLAIFGAAVLCGGANASSGALATLLSNMAVNEIVQLSSAVSGCSTIYCDPGGFNEADIPHDCKHFDGISTPNCDGTLFTSDGDVQTYINSGCSAVTCTFNQLWQYSSGAVSADTGEVMFCGGGHATRGTTSCFAFEPQTAAATCRGSPGSHACSGSWQLAFPGGMFNLASGCPGTANQYLEDCTAPAAPNDFNPKQLLDVILHGSGGGINCGTDYTQDIVFVGVNYQGNVAPPNAHNGFGMVPMGPHLWSSNPYSATRCGTGGPGGSFILNTASLPTRAVAMLGQYTYANATRQAGSGQATDPAFSEVPIGGVGGPGDGNVYSDAQGALYVFKAPASGYTRIGPLSGTGGISCNEASGNSGWATTATYNNAVMFADPNNTTQMDYFMFIGVNNHGDNPQYTYWTLFTNVNANGIPIGCGAYTWSSVPSIQANELPGVCADPDIPGTLYVDDGTGKLDPIVINSTTPTNSTFTLETPSPALSGHVMQVHGNGNDANGVGAGSSWIGTSVDNRCAILSAHNPITGGHKAAIMEGVGGIFVRKLSRLDLPSSYHAPMIGYLSHLATNDTVAASDLSDAA